MSVYRELYVEVQMAKGKSLLVRVTEAELVKLDAQAKDQGLNRSAYVRRMLGLGTPEGSTVVGNDSTHIETRIMSAVKSAGRQEINKNALDKIKPGVSVDQWGIKRSLAKPKKK
jgi:hypothetical protein